MSKIAITGSASGIGRETARQLAEQGHEIIGLDLRHADIEVDLSTSDGRQQAIEGVLAECGGVLDGLVTAAGLGGHLEDGGLVATVNYFGTVDLLDGLFPTLSKSEDARVVAVSSNSAQMGDNTDNPIVLALLENDHAKAMELIGDLPAAATYGLSKHAVSRAVRVRAAEWGAAGVRLNAIAPGMTETPLFAGSRDHPELGERVKQIPIPLERYAQPEEIARVICLMMGDEFAYMHGSVVWLDGGTDALIRPQGF
ncbi:MAG: SDR family oxidoreductase [Parvibaculales bacterium]